jgi:hypothetical protein
MKNRLLVFAVIAFCLSGAIPAMVSGQKKVIAPQVRRAPRKPTVYVSLGRMPISHDLTELNQSNESLRLELHNNTRWDILCYLAGAPTAPPDVPMIYRVEDSEGCSQLPQPIGDVIFTQKIQPGGFVSFMVPRKYLSKGHGIFVEFNYSWEIRDGIAPYGVEPNHRAYLHSSQLPDNLR